MIFIKSTIKNRESDKQYQPVIAYISYSRCYLLFSCYVNRYLHLPKTILPDTSIFNLLLLCVQKNSISKYYSANSRWLIKHLVESFVLYFSLLDFIAFILKKKYALYSMHFAWLFYLSVHLKQMV